MGITLGSNFDLQTGLPLDSRLKVNDLTARDAINSLIRYEGMIVYVVSEGTNFQLKGGIANVNWEELSGSGGAGAGDINWSINPFFSKDLTGVTSTDDVNLAISRTTSVGEVQLPHISKGSLKIAKAASDESTEYVQITDNASISPYLSDQNLAVVTVKVDTTVDANYVHESFVIDVVNGSGTSLVVGGTVAIKANTNTEYQVLINPKGQTAIDTRLVCTNTNTTAYSFVVGSHFIGELGQIVFDGQNDYKTWTPGFAGLGSPTVNHAMYKVVGDTAFVDARIILGTTSPAAAYMTLPSTLIPSSKYTAPTVVGYVEYGSGTTDRNFTAFLNVGGSTDRLYFGYRDASGNAITTPTNGNTMFTTGYVLHIKAQFKIDNSVAKNTLTNYELGIKNSKVYASFVTPTGTLSASWNKVIFGSVEGNKFGNYNTSTGVWTADKNGEIDVSSYLEINHSSSSAACAIRVINTTTGKFVACEVVRATRSESKPQTTGMLKVSKGDTVEVQSFAAVSSPSFGVSLTGSGFSISYREDFLMYNVIPAFEKIKLSSNGPITYVISSGQYGDLTNFLVPKNQEWDIHIQARVQSNNASSFNFGLGTVSGNNAFDTTEGEGWSAVDKLSSIGRVGVSLVYNHEPKATDTVYYLKSFMSLASTTNITWQVFARRIR